MLIINSWSRPSAYKTALKLCSVYSNNRLSSDKVITLEVDKLDVMDNFTSDLIHRKSVKWDKIKIKKPLSKTTCSLVQPKQLEITLNKLSQEELDQQFTHIINDGTSGNIEDFLKRCERMQVRPSFRFTLQLLDAHSVREKINIIQVLKGLYKDDLVFKTNAKFDHYLAEAYWMNGEIVKALQLFENVYENNSCMRRRIRMMLKFLIADVTTHSEAILVSIIKFSEKLYKVYRDSFALTCVWQACFLSEWYSDQKLALQLLENNHGLCEAVVGTLPYVVMTALKQHQVEVVYRLLELLIKYEMKTQYAVILVSLFNYKFYVGDLKSCSEIIQWAVTYDVRLPQIIHERFLMLLLNRKNVDDAKPPKPPEPRVDLKF